MPIGGGVFLEASTHPLDKLIINVGAGVVIEKTKQETVDFLEERIKEFESAIQNFEVQKSDLASKINENRVTINSIVEKQKRSQQS